MKLKYIKDGGELKKVDLDEILTELNILLTWVVENLEDVNLKYMKSRVEGLQTIIPKAFTEDDTNLYIF